MKKHLRTNFIYDATWKKMKFFTAEIACSKASTFSQTDSVDEMNWFSSKLLKQLAWKTKTFTNRFELWNELVKFKAQTACLKNSIFSQTEPVYEKNWLISKLQSLNGLLGNFNFLANWSSLRIELKFFTVSYIK